MTQQMAPLPAFRSEYQQSPFHTVGVDYAGHFIVYERGKPIKYYICNFVCMSTKAIHSEAVPDLSTSAFIDHINVL